MCCCKPNCLAWPLATGEEEPCYTLWDLAMNRCAWSSNKISALPLWFPGSLHCHNSHSLWCRLLIHPFDLQLWRRGPELARLTDQTGRNWGRKPLRSRRHASLAQTEIYEGLIQRGVVACRGWSTVVSSRLGSIACKLAGISWSRPCSNTNRFYRRSQ